MKKQVDLEQYTPKIDDTFIRRIFINDIELIKLYCVLNNHNPITISELTRTYNRVFITNHSKSWTTEKLRKVEHFKLFIKKSYKECLKTKTDKIEDTIISKHKQWVSTLPPQFEKGYERNIYYVLTEEGDKWMEFIEQQLKKIKGG